MTDSTQGSEHGDGNPSGSPVVDKDPTLQVVVDGQAVADAETTLPDLVAVFNDFARVATLLGGRLPDITVLLATDLHAAMAEVTGQPDFTGERLGGIVTGKTVRADPQWSAATVILPIGLWPQGQPTLPAGVLLLAHELGHALLGGLRKGEAVQPVDGDNDATVYARAYAVECVDEIRADILADTVLGNVMSVVPEDGDPRPATTIDVFGSRSESVAEMLGEHVHPGWPDLVESYRNHQTDLTSLWQTLCNETPQALVTMAHTDAEHLIDPSLPSAVDSAADHPGMIHYLGPVWQTITASIAGQDLIPPVDELAASDAGVGATGGDAILAMWATLGVTAETTDDGRLYLHVNEPKGTD